MQRLKDDFNDRSGEIWGYLNLLKFIEYSGNEILSTENELRYQITPDVRKTLKGAIYIILYNLIESTMREAICYIHETIYRNNVSFDELCPTLQKEILKRIKHNSITIDNLIKGQKNGISFDISYTSFNRKTLFSGNIDIEEIKKKSKIYGFSTDCEYTTTKHGEKLSTVKTHRNDLAHGNVSFSKIGQNMTYADLEATCSEVISYLESILHNIEDYIKKSSYLALQDES